MEKGLRIGLDKYNQIYNAGLRNGEIEFLNNFVSTWLNKYPNDIQSNIFKSEIDFSSKNQREARSRIQSVLESDPVLI